MILERPEVDRAALAARTGWEIKPEGACKADRCVPLPDAPADGPIDARMLADRLGMALVADEAHGLWALGPESGGRALLVGARCPTSSCPTATGDRSRCARCAARGS